MSARSPTEVYLCVNRPGSLTSGQRGLIKFTNLAVNSNIEWFVKEGPWGDASTSKSTAVTPHQTDSSQVYYAMFAQPASALSSNNIV